MCVKDHVIVFDSVMDIRVDQFLVHPAYYDRQGGQKRKLPYLLLKVVEVFHKSPFLSTWYWIVHKK